MFAFFRRVFGFIFMYFLALFALISLFNSSKGQSISYSLVDFIGYLQDTLTNQDTFTGKLVNQFQIQFNAVNDYMEGNYFTEEDSNSGIIGFFSNLFGIDSSSGFFTALSYILGFIPALLRLCAVAIIGLFCLVFISFRLFGYFFV